MHYNTVILDNDSGIFTLTLNRPGKMNPLNLEMLEEATHSISEVSKNDDARVLIITGAGKAFCSGGDLNMPLFGGIAAGTTVLKQMNMFNEFILAIRDLKCPVIAAVNGDALGGGFNVALACDIRIASETARFGQIFTKLGVIPDLGGTYFLPRLVGTAKACELVFSGDIISAEEAFRMGLVNRVVSADKLTEEVNAISRKICMNAAGAIRMAKVAIYAGAQNDLPIQLQLEALYQTICLQSEDLKEGVRAFKEKRPPCFRGF